MRGTVEPDTLDALPGPSHAHNSRTSGVESWSGAGRTHALQQEEAASYVANVGDGLQVSLDP